jgi:hypothetical protein
MIIISGMKTNMRHNKRQEGITLLITLLLMGVLLGVSASLLNVTLKQYQLSGISYISEIAFQAAAAGMECALYQDFVNDEFDPNPRNDIQCFGGVNSADDFQATDPDAESGEEQRFKFTWGSPAVCSEFSVYKFYIPDDGVPPVVMTPLVIDTVDIRPGSPCPEGSECTVIKSRGYNVPCDQRMTDSKVVEREYTQVY